MATATPKVPTAVNVSVLRITRPGVLGMENKDTGDVNGDIFFAVFEVLLEGNYGSGFLPYLSNGSALYSQAQIWHNPLHGPYAMQVGHCFKAFPFARLILSHAKPTVCNPMSLIPFAFSCDGTASCIALPIARSVSITTSWLAPLYTRHRLIVSYSLDTRQGLTYSPQPSAE